MDPCSCGRIPVVGDNFCGGCGTAIVAASAPATEPLRGPTVDDTLGGGLLIGGSRPEEEAEDSITSESQVKSSAQLRWVLVGVAVLGVLVFALAQWPQSEPPPQAAAESETDTAGDDDRDAEDAEAEDMPEDEPDEPPEVEIMDEEFEFTPETDEDTGDDAAEDGGAEEEEASPTPILPEPTGLGLIISMSSGKHQLLDLDTGETHEFGASGQPIGMVGSTLVLQSQQGDRVLLNDLSDPEAESVELPRELGTHQQIMSIEDETIWVIAYQIQGSDVPEPTYQAFDSQGNLVDAFTDDDGRQYWSLQGAADLVEVQGGGIYRRDGDDYERVSDGALLASGENLALIKRCDDRMNCSAFWFDRSDWQEVSNLPSPDVSFFANNSIHGGDKWLVQTDWNGGSAELIEIATGRTVRTIQTRNHFYGPVMSFPISDDGRWLVDQSETVPIIVDLLSGAEYQLVLEGRTHPNQTPLFVEMAATAFG